MKIDVQLSPTLMLKTKWACIRIRVKSTFSDNVLSAMSSSPQKRFCIIGVHHKSHSKELLPSLLDADTKERKDKLSQ